MLARRSFLLGLGAALAAPVLARAGGEMISYGQLDPRIRFRRIFKMTLSCNDIDMADQHLPITYSVLKNSEMVLQASLNQRARYYWRAGEIIIADTDLFEVRAEPGRNANIDITFDAERDRKQPSLCFIERFGWRDGELRSTLLESCGQ